MSAGIGHKRSRKPGPRLSYRRHIREHPRAHQRLIWGNVILQPVRVFRVAVSYNHLRSRWSLRIRDAGRLVQLLRFQSYLPADKVEPVDTAEPNLRTGVCTRVASSSNRVSEVNDSAASSRGTQRPVQVPLLG